MCVWLWAEAKRSTTRREVVLRCVSHEGSAFGIMTRVHYIWRGMLQPEALSDRLTCSASLDFADCTRGTGRHQNTAGC